MSDPYDGLSTDPNVAGILGENTAGGPGVSGRGTPAGDFESASSDGVYAISSSPQHCGVAAANDSGGIGVFGRGTPGGGFESQSGEGVNAISHSPQHCGVVGVNDAGNAGVSGFQRIASDCTTVTLVYGKQPLFTRLPECNAERTLMGTLTV